MDSSSEAASGAELVGGGTKGEHQATIHDPYSGFGRFIQEP